MLLRAVSCGVVIIKLCATAAVVLLALAQSDNGPREPFKVFGNTYHVGTSGLGSILITNGGPSILIDGALTQSPPIIEANIRKLGFKPEDVRLIVASHAHFDHVGGIAALQRASGAEVAARAPQKAALERGEPTPDDPQFGFGKKANEYPALKNVRRRSASAERDRPDARVPRPDRAPERKTNVAFDVVTVAEGLENPWGLAFLP
jgi:metallo-beta-lactamase class B